MTVQEYIQKINQLYKSNISTEHSYRPDLRNLIESMFPGLMATNEPQRIACGAPDYIITKKGIPIGFIEAKDVGADLFNKTYKEQFDRYKSSLNNLIITDYLTFQFFVDGILSTTITIGQIQNGRVVALTSNFDLFTRRLIEFCSFTGQTITSSQKLARLMAAKARLLADVIELALSGEQSAGNLFEEANNTLREQMEAFRKVLIHDIDNKSFADMYAQTIAYGMFAARLNDPSLDTFTRQEAAELVPKSNPFLRRLFQYIAGYDLDDRIKWIVDTLADLFRATNVAELLSDFGSKEHRQDPIIHFYETFLSEYDPALRKSRGVWYTPHPVVNFIVRAVDDILKDEFGLHDGLADTSKVKIKVNELGKKIEKEVHRVQVLDPAAGTGTFLAEIISQVHKKFKGQQGLWNNYVEEHLVPRLNGFELLMASYAMAHLKLELLLKETGYQPTRDQRLRVYLTNSLEEYHPDTGTLFASWLSHEANEANMIKRDTPVMVVVMNPPYSVSSSNKGEWIQSMIADYKKDLNERKLNLDDDYIKFIRYGEYLIDKNGEGIIAFISNNSFIDGVTHRQMRKHLLETFDKIYILDLHGNSKKKETAPDGSKDDNVFDIMQGVSINLFIKTNKKRKNDLGQVFHYDLFGQRQHKYDMLLNISNADIPFSLIDMGEPYFFFVPKDFSKKSEYFSYFSITEFMTVFVSGFQTKRDKITIKFQPDELFQIKEIFVKNPVEKIRNILDLPPDGRDWRIEWAKQDLIINNPRMIRVMYRPFDNRYSFYTGKSKGFIAYPREEMIACLQDFDSMSIITCRQQSTFNFQHVFVSRYISDMCNISSQTKETGYIFPLYLSKGLSTQKSFREVEVRTPNLNPIMVNQIAESLNLQFTPEKELTEGTFAPIDLLDYIYAVLHSPTYREKYKEFLKIDFPRVPYPKDADTFWQLISLGGELRQLHLMESPVLNNLITQYPVGGSNNVEKVTYANGRVHINPEQYFDNVPQVAWEFYIGGYQPAQKWLKDRKGRTLLFDDILHYQKIIVALVETDRLMKEIDTVNIE